MIKGNYKQCYVDNLGNYYLLTGDNTLKKFNSQGQQKHSINLKMLGKLATVDVTSPLEVLLHYPDADVLVLVDNTLSVKQRVELGRTGYGEVELAAYSTEEGFWIFDESDGRLKRIDKQGNTIHESNPLYRYARENLEPENLLAYGSRVYLNNPKSGIMVFDNYGTYIKTLPLAGIRTFEAGKHVLTYWDGKKAGSFDLRTGEKLSLDLPLKPLPEEAVQIRYKKGMLLVLDNQGLKIYKG